VELNKNLYMPRVVEKGKMLAVKVCEKTRFTTSKTGICEPESGGETLAELCEKTLVIAPLLGYSKMRERLGYGGGYYDRFLADCNAKIVALAYSCQEVEAGFFEPHDIKPDKIFTERGVLCG
jgi:5-formyltetrahydrofolate cyclo-ligase